MHADRLKHEKKVVSTMVRLYCRGQGHHEPVCADCRDLLAYAILRIDDCPFGDDKHFCSQCQVHCYEPHMRERIRAVMRHSGPRMLWHHPLTAIRHLLKR